MGLKTTNYTVERFGVVMSNAYARIANVSVDKNGNATCLFDITKTRNDTNEAIETHHFRCVVDKDAKIHEQIYNLAKKDLFKNWDDDIVEGE